MRRKGTRVPANVAMRVAFDIVTAACNITDRQWSCDVCADAQCVPAFVPRLGQATVALR